MKVMVVGGGGREHAIIKKLKENKDIEKIYALPGNGGMKDDAECVNIGAKDIEKIVEFAVKEKIDYAVVAPDDPLVLGAVDELEAKEKEETDIRAERKKAIDACKEFIEKQSQFDDNHLDAEDIGSIKKTIKALNALIKTSGSVNESVLPRNAKTITATPRDGGASMKLTKKDGVWLDGKQGYDNSYLRNHYDIKVDEVDPNYKPNRTKRVAVLQGNYGYGWDDLAEYEPGSRELKVDLKAYRENELNAAHRVIYRRIPVDTQE